MIKESIQERIELLKKDKNYHSNMLQMIEGAIQDCQHWLSELEKEEDNSESESDSE